MPKSIFQCALAPWCFVLRGTRYLAQVSQHVQRMRAGLWRRPLQGAKPLLCSVSVALTLLWDADVQHSMQPLPMRVRACHSAALAPNPVGGSEPVMQTSTTSSIRVPQRNAAASRQASQCALCKPPWTLNPDAGDRLRRGDLETMSNTAKCQLSRAVHSQVGMDDPATASGAILPLSLECSLLKSAD